MWKPAARVVVWTNSLFKSLSPACEQPLGYDLIESPLTLVYG